MGERIGAEGVADVNEPLPLLDLQAEVAELDAIEAESIGWLPLGEGAYLHVGKPQEEEVVITVTGVPEVGMVGMNVLLVGW